MDNSRPPDYEDSQDSQRGQYGYQQQPYSPQYSWQPPPTPYGDHSNQQQSYGEQQRRYDYAQGRPSEQYQEHPPQQTYPYKASHNVVYHDGSAQHQYSHSQSDPFPAPQGQVQPPNTEEERGVLGALAGGAAGAYGGHKLGHHGFLGGLAGAYLGHKLEDKYKESHHHGRPHSRHSSRSSSSSPSPDHHPAKPVGPEAPHGAPADGHFAGNFSASARQISLDRDYNLIAECGTIDGHKKVSSISLNSVLMNNDGNFQWVQGGNFGASARNVRLADGGKILEAELCSRDGHWRHAWVCLDEKIENSDGDLRLTS